LGFLAGISGLVGVVCAVKGYALFAKNESVKGVVIAIVCAVAVQVIAWYLCLSFDVYNVYQDWYANGEVDFTPTFAESVRNAYVFLSEPEIASSYFLDLGLGLVLCVVGAARSVIDAVKRVKNKAEPTKDQEQPPVDSDPSAF
jgi:hypothetical protein